MRIRSFILPALTTVLVAPSAAAAGTLTASGACFDQRAPFTIFGSAFAPERSLDIDADVADEFGLKIDATAYAESDDTKPKFSPNTRPEFDKSFSIG